MKHRTVFRAPDMAVVRRAMDAARKAGVDDDDLSLIARSDIALDEIPDDRKLVEGDFYPAAVKGLVGGGTVGLLAGLAAAVFAPIGITVAGVVGCTVAGASLGGWSTALAGSAVPDPVHREFEGVIERGGILLVVDVDESRMQEAVSGVAATGARQLPFDHPTVMS